MAADSALWHTLTAMPEVSHVQRYATKAGVFRTDDDFMGYVLKGVGEDYDLSFYAQYLQEGILIKFAISRFLVH